MSGYLELRRLLASRARTLLAGLRPPNSVAGTSPELVALRRQCDAFEAAGLVEVLRKVETGWPKGLPPQVESVALAAHGFVGLTILDLDTLEMADLLPGKALALLALAEAMGRNPDAADEALLASSLGYRADASKLASSLSADDPVRLFADGRKEDLVRLAGEAGASRQVSYLALLALANPDDEAAWEAFASRHFAAELSSLPVLRAAAQLESFEANASLGTAAVYGALEAVSVPSSGRAELETHPEAPPRDGVEAMFRALAERIRQSLKPEPAGLVRTFEGELAKRCAATPGPLWDADVCRSWYRSLFYSGLYALGHRYLDELADPEGVRQLAAYLQGSPEGPGAQFARWYSHMASLASGQSLTKDHYDDLSNLTWLGKPVVERTARTLSANLQWPEEQAEIAAATAQRLDGRPPHAGAMTVVASYTLRDHPMTERLCRAWLDLGIPVEPGWAARCQIFLAPVGGLQALVDRRDLELAVRAEALSLYCFFPGASHEFCQSRFRTLAEECGYDRTATFPWLQYCDKHEDYAGSQRAAEGWLAHHDESAGLIWSVYRGRLAYSLAMQGHNAQAWRIIEPVLGTGQGAIMGWGAEILARLRRTQEAYELARRMVERYPGGDSGGGRTVLAELLWRADRDSEAALVLDPPEPGYKVDLAVWRDDVSRRFASVFDKQPDARVISAFGFLQGQNIGGSKLAYLIPPLAAQGRHELAFRLETSISHTHKHPWDVAKWNENAYNYLEKARGRAEASAWLQKIIPVPWREQVLEAFFRDKAFALLWDAVPSQEEPKQSEWVWLLRAAAATGDPATASARRGEILEHYRQAMSASPERVMGRYLLGLEGREEVVHASKTPGDRCKAAYVFGLREIAGGRYDEASDWLQVVFDGCEETDWQVQAFARATLVSWFDAAPNLREAEHRKIW